MSDKQVLFCMTGLTYGLALSFWGYLTVALGEGTYVPIGISSSPLGLFSIFLVLLGMPVLWTAVGFLLGKVGTPSYRTAFWVVMVIHYVGIVPLLTIEPYGDWERFVRMWGGMKLSITGHVVTYLVGQVAIWFAYLNTKWQKA